MRYARGDTLIEVLLAMTIFSAVVTSAIFVMNRSIGTAQRSLEITQVRAQIDTQVELLQHINSIAIVNIDAARANSSTSSIADNWQRIRRASIASNAIPAFSEVSNMQQCNPNNAIRQEYRNGSGSNAFFINPLSGQVELINSSGLTPNLVAPVTFARVVQEASGATGRPRAVSHMLWIYATRSTETVRDLQGGSDGTRPLSSYYDFHIRACWQSPIDGSLQKIGTIVRLYAPEQ